MRKLVIVTVAALIAVLGLTVWGITAAGAQAERPGIGAGLDANRIRANIEQAIDRMLDGMGLTATEKTATRAAINQKLQARTKLQEQQRALAEAVQGKVTDAAARKALDRYKVAQRNFDQQIAGIDSGLAKKVSVRSQARLTAAGIMDNGLGIGLRGSRMGMGRRGAPGLGGGPRPGAGR